MHADPLPQDHESVTARTRPDNHPVRRARLLNCWLLITLIATAPINGSVPIETTPARQRVEQPGPLVIAHRGFSQQAPENTLPAFRLALAARADLVELDYHVSRDGVPVVIHDSTLDRTTDATNRWTGKAFTVTSHTAAEIRTLDAGSWFNPTFQGTQVPTLREALAVIQRSGCTLIERKSGDAGALVRLLGDKGLLGEVVVQSFDWGFVKACHQLAPTLILGALGPPSWVDGRKLEPEEKALSAEFLTAIEDTGARLVVWNDQVTATSVAEAHRRGFRVWIYTIDDASKALALVALGVDGIITNDPDTLRSRLLPEADEDPIDRMSRGIPAPLPERPGNIHLEGDSIRVRWPEGLPVGALEWRIRDDRNAIVGRGTLAEASSRPAEGLDAGPLGVGWYRIEFGPAERSDAVWTTAAVLPRLRAAVPADSPVGVDSATAWFARNDAERQRQLANLAALAGVNWVRDRLRWSDLQPAAGALTSAETTYDTAASIQRAAGLKVLQVFHDTPAWARETERGGGRFAPDLRTVHEFARDLARRFHGRITAWEPWNEANVETFGGHTVDQMCSWQKAAYLGFKAGDPEVLVGWHPTAAVPTPEHTEGVMANATWPYFDTYNIHTYDWSHSYRELWEPARRAVAGRPLWITEADRGTPHLKQAPWYDQDAKLERLKAEWMAQSYASSLFAGARRHFHFILGHYHEPNGVQFGLLRLDLTPRPAYVALAAVGRCLAGARALGRWQPVPDLHVHAFQARPDGKPRDVLVIWAEREVDWPERGNLQIEWSLPSTLTPEAIVDYLGRPLGAFPSRVASAPVFVLLPPGKASTLELEAPPALDRFRSGDASPLVLQLALPRSATVKVEDRPWSEGHAYRLDGPAPLELPLQAYNLGAVPIRGRWSVVSHPPGWQLEVPAREIAIESMGRITTTGQLTVPADSPTRDGWIVLRMESDADVAGPASLAFRLRRP